MDPQLSLARVSWLIISPGETSQSHIWPEIVPSQIIKPFVKWFASRLESCQTY